MKKFNRFLCRSVIAIVLLAFCGTLSANEITAKLNASDWSFRGEGQLDFSGASGLELSAPRDESFSADAILWQLLPGVERPGPTEGTLRFEYRGTAAERERFGHGSVSLMGMAERDGKVREVKGRKWRVLDEAEPKAWKKAEIPFRFSSESMRAIVLRVSLGDREIPKTVPGPAELEIRNLVFEAPDRLPVLEAMESMVEITGQLRFRAPRATWLGPEYLNTDRFMPERYGYFALYPDLEAPENNWLDVIVPDPDPVALNYIEFRTYIDRDEPEESNDAFGEGFTLFAADENGKPKPCELVLATDRRLIFAVPSGLRSTQFRLFMDDGRYRDYRIFKVRAFAEEDPQLQADQWDIDLSLHSEGEVSEVFKSDEPVRIHVRVAGGEGAGQARFRLRVADHYDDALDGVEDRTGSFQLSGGLDQNFELPPLPSGSYKVSVELTREGRLLAYTREKFGVSGLPELKADLRDEAAGEKDAFQFSCVVGHYYSRPQKFSTRTLDNLKASGFDGVSLWLHWSEVEPFQDVYNLSHLDATLDYCASIDLGVEIYVVVGDHSTPEWVDESQFQRYQNGELAGSRWYLHLPLDEPGRIPSAEAPVMKTEFPALFGLLAERYAEHPAVRAWYVGPPALEVFFWSRPWDAAKGLVSDFSKWNVDGFKKFLNGELGYSETDLKEQWDGPLAGIDDVVPVAPKFEDGYDLRYQAYLYLRYQKYVAANYYKRSIEAIRNWRQGDLFMAGELSEYTVWEPNQTLKEKVADASLPMDHILARSHSVDTDVSSGPAIGLFRAADLPVSLEHGWVPPREELFHYGFFNLMGNGVARNDLWRWQGEPVFGPLLQKVGPIAKVWKLMEGAEPVASGVAALISDRSFNALQRFSYSWGAPVAADGNPLYRVKGGLIGALADMEYQWGCKLDWLPVEAGFPDLGGHELIFDLYSIFMPPSQEAALRDWVEQGGTLVLSGLSTFGQGASDRLPEILPELSYAPIRVEQASGDLFAEVEPFGMALYDFPQQPSGESVLSTAEGATAVSVEQLGAGRVIRLHGDLAGLYYGDYRSFLTRIKELAGVAAADFVIEGGALHGLMTEKAKSRFLSLYHHSEASTTRSRVILEGEDYLEAEVRCLYPADAKVRSSIVNNQLTIDLETDLYDLVVFEVVLPDAELEAESI